MPKKVLILSDQYPDGTLVPIVASQDERIVEAALRAMAARVRQIDPDADIDFAPEPAA